MILITNILGITLTGITPFVSLENWKGTILFCLVVLFWVQKIYFGWRKNQQDIKKGDLNLRKQEHEVNKEIEEDEGKQI